EAAPAAAEVRPGAASGGRRVVGRGGGRSRTLKPAGDGCLSSELVQQNRGPVLRAAGDTHSEQAWSAPSRPHFGIQILFWLPLVGARPRRLSGAPPSPIAAQGGELPAAARVPPPW